MEDETETEEVMAEFDFLGSDSSDGAGEARSQGESLSLLLASSELSSDANSRTYGCILFSSWLETIAEYIVGGVIGEVFSFISHWTVMIFYEQKNRGIPLRTRKNGM